MADLTVASENPKNQDVMGAASQGINQHVTKGEILGDALRCLRYAEKYVKTCRQDRGPDTYVYRNLDGDVILTMVRIADEKIRVGRRLLCRKRPTGAGSS